MSGLKLLLLGPPQIELDGTPVTIRRSKVLALLIYLAVSGEGQRRDTLATLLWPDSTQSRARSALRHELSILNKTLGGAWLEIEGEMIALRPDVWLDVTRLQRGLLDFNADDPASLDTLTKAIDLYRDDFLTGFTLTDCPDFDEWQFFQTESLRQTFATALETLTTALDDRQDYDMAIPYARRWVAIDALHEPAHQRLMRLYALSGRQAAALHQFSECKRILQSELNLEPDAQTVALEAAIREKRLAPPDVDSSSHPPARQSHAPISTGASPAAPLPSLIKSRSVFVGRESQLAELNEALAQAVRGQGQLRIITGEAGAGKSALITEFLYLAQNKQTDLVVTAGASDAQTGQVDPFLPFREALLMLVSEAETDQPSAWKPSACLALLEQGPDLAESFIPEADLPALLALAQGAGWQGQRQAAKPAPANPQPLKQSKIIEQYVAVLKALAVQNPVILVLEDLHWADTASLGLFYRLAKQVGDTRLLLVGSYRSEQAHLPRQTENAEESLPLAKMINELQRHLGEITIDLEAVREREGRTLVDKLLDAEPNQLNESFRQALYHQTGGHPLFVVELLQDLKKSAALVQDAAGNWIVGTRLDWQALPARVEGAIAGRITRLSNEQRWLLTIASVSGERFLVEAVAQVAGIEPRQFVETLSRDLQTQHRLVEAEGVERLGEGRLTRYHFRHNLIQVYLYEQLDEVQRIYLHEDVARALEMLYGAEAETIALPLARHYQAAGVAQKGVDYLILAGDQAARLAANEEAVQHFSQALSLLAALPENIERDRQELILQSNLGQALLISKGFGAPEVEVAYTHALVLARQLGETGQITQALFGLAQHALFRSELAVARTYGQECLRLVAEGQDPELMLAVNRILSRIASQLGQHAEAVTYYEQVVAFYRARQPTLTFDDAYALAYSLAVMGFQLVPLGYPDRALRQAQESLALVQRQAHHFGTVHCQCIMAYIHLLRGDWPAALQYAEEAIAGANTHNFAQLRAFAQLHQGVALTRLGQAEVGVGLVHQAIAEREAMGITFGHQSTTLARLAEACGSAGRVAEGLALVNEALAALDSSNERQYEPKLHQIKGDLLLLQDLAGDELVTTRQEAEACFRQAIEIAQNQGAKLWEARALASLCRLLHTQGRDEGCRQQLADLYAWFTEGFETEDLQVVWAVLQETA